MSTFTNLDQLSNFVGLEIVFGVRKPILFDWCYTEERIVNNSLWKLRHKSVSRVGVHHGKDTHLWVCFVLFNFVRTSCNRSD